MIINHNRNVTLEWSVRNFWARGLNKFYVSTVIAQGSAVVKNIKLPGLTHQCTIIENI